MKVPPNGNADADDRAPTILGQSHELLAEVATRAAREAADRHVEAGRLASARRLEEPGARNPDAGSQS